MHLSLSTPSAWKPPIYIAATVPWPISAAPGLDILDLWARPSLHFFRRTPHPTSRDRPRAARDLDPPVRPGRVGGRRATAVGLRGGWWRIRSLKGDTTFRSSVDFSGSVLVAPKKHLGSLGLFLRRVRPFKPRALLSCPHPSLLDGSNKRQLL